MNIGDKFDHDGREHTVVRKVPDDGPACPRCGERDIDELVWVEDHEVNCQTCGYRWNPQGDRP